MYIHLVSQNIQLGLSQNLDPQNSMLYHWLHLCPQQYHARSLDCVFPWSSKINLDPPAGQTLPFPHLLWSWKVGRGWSMGSNTLWCYPSVLCCRAAKTFRWSTTVFGGLIIKHGKVTVRNWSRCANNCDFSINLGVSRTENGKLTVWKSGLSNRSGIPLV